MTERIEIESALSAHLREVLRAGHVAADDLRDIEREARRAHRDYVGAVALLARAARTLPARPFLRRFPRPDAARLDLLLATEDET